MQTYQFKAPPEILVEALPFDPNKPAFMDWLNRLPFNNSFSACQKLYKVLIALDRAGWDSRLEFDFLHTLIPLVDNLAQRLEYVYLDSGFPLTEEETANVELLGWTFRQLSGRFSYLFQQMVGEGETWTTGEKAATLFKALYSAGRMQLCANQVYLLMHSGFWQEVYLNYRRAEQYALLNYKIDQEGGGHSTISTVFKRILIFDICDTQCFRSREMKNLYMLLTKFSDMAVISNTPPENHVIGVFRFDLDSDRSAEAWTPAMTVGDKLSRYVNVVPAAKMIYQTLQRAESGHKTLQSVNKPLLLKVVSMLSKGVKRKYTRFSAEGNANGFIGFNNVVSMIAGIRGKTADKLVPALTYDPRIAGHWKQPDFDLVPLGDEFEHQLNQKQHAKGTVDGRLANVLQGSQQRHSPSGKSERLQSERDRLTEEVTVGHFDVFNTSVKGYGLIWESGTKKVKIGDIFGIEQDQGKRLEIGLVRRISVQTSNMLRLGIELIGLESDLVWLVHAGVNKDHGALAIFISSIPALKQPDSIVVANINLKSGQTVIVYRNESKISCKLGIHLHSTPAINHFELIYDAVV